MTPEPRTECFRFVLAAAHACNIQNTREFESRAHKYVKRFK